MVLVLSCVPRLSVRLFALHKTIFPLPSFSKIAAARSRKEKNGNSNGRFVFPAGAQGAEVEAAKRAARGDHCTV